MRERFVKLLEEKNLLEKTAQAIQKNQNINEILKDVVDFTAGRNHEFYFNWKHYSSAEGAGVYVVSENNPIYGTSFQQDFYYPLTTMELSTRYSRKFSLDRVYWDSTLMNSEFKDEIKKVFAANFELYEKGFDVLMEVAKGRQTDLKTKISALDSLRLLIPVAAYTTVIIGGNARAVFEHMKNLLSYNDNFTKDYAQKSLDELTERLEERGFLEEGWVQSGGE